MVFIKNTKKERKKIKGKLATISTDEGYDGVIDRDLGKYNWIDLGIEDETQKIIIDGEQKNKLIFIRAYAINMEKMPELKKADELLKEGIKPIIEVEYYEKEVEGKDKDGQPKTYLNLRSSREDIINTFKIIDEEGVTQNHIEITEEKVQ